MRPHIVWIQQADSFHIGISDFLNPGEMMSPVVRKKIRAHGVCVLLSGHPEVRRLKAHHVPSTHGNKVWTSSWVLMDYINKQDLPGKRRVMEVGCGWGLTGLYFAKKWGARVTAVDMDPEVFPYLELQAKANGVKIETLRRAFGGIEASHLKGFDLLIGADICLWDSMILPLKRLVNRALKSGVQTVLIADPGRPPFHELCDYYSEKQGAETFSWTTRRPRRIQAKILRIGKKWPVNGKAIFERRSPGTHKR